MPCGLAPCPPARPCSARSPEVRQAPKKDWQLQCRIAAASRKALRSAALKLCGNIEFAFTSTMPSTLSGCQHQGNRRDLDRLGNTSASAQAARNGPRGPQEGEAMEAMRPVQSQTFEAEGTPGKPWQAQQAFSRSPAAQQQCLAICFSTCKGD